MCFNTVDQKYSMQDYTEESLVESVKDKLCSPLHRLRFEVIRTLMKFHMCWDI